MVATSSTAARPLAGPCAPARSEVDTRCAEAERLAQAAVAHQQRVRDLRQELMAVTAQREADVHVRDRRQVNASKQVAQTAYRAALRQAKNDSAIHEAARVWLREIDRLNRQFRRADHRAGELARRANELEQALPGVELAADAARISAEAAQSACNAARHALAECEEQAQRRLHVSAAGAGVAAPAAQVAAPASQSGISTIALVLRGDRKTLQAITLRLAEETGIEAGRLQLLLLELREQIAVQALAAQALRFPDKHPFWSQFTAADARLIAANLAAMGYRFDGRGGWADGRAPSMRELSVAVSNIGLDPRAMRRTAGDETIDKLWLGTTVVVEEYLATRAPDLDLQDVMACLGTHGTNLGELWDLWGRLRPLLLAAA